MLLLPPFGFFPFPVTPPTICFFHLLSPIPLFVFPISFHFHYLFFTRFPSLIPPFVFPYTVAPPQLFSPISGHSAHHLLLLSLVAPPTICCCSVLSFLSLFVSSTLCYWSHHLFLPSSFTPPNVCFSQLLLLFPLLFLPSPVTPIPLHSAFPPFGSPIYCHSSHYLLLQFPATSPTFCFSHRLLFLPSVVFLPFPVTPPTLCSSYFLLLFPLFVSPISCHPPSHLFFPSFITIPTICFSHLLLLILNFLSPIRRHSSRFLFLPSTDLPTTICFSHIRSLIPL